MQRQIETDVGMVDGIGLAKWKFDRRLIGLANEILSAGEQVVVEEWLTKHLTIAQLILMAAATSPDLRAKVEETLRTLAIETVRNSPFNPYGPR